MKDFQDTIRQIQEEAKRKVEAARYSKRKSPIVKDVVQQTSSQELLTNLKEQFSTAIAEALATKAARKYIGDVTGELQDFAAETIESVRTQYDFGGNLRFNGDTVIYPNNCKLLVFNAQESKGTLIIEESPQYRTVFHELENDWGRSKLNTFRIPLPYLVYLIGFRYNEDKQQFTYTNLGIGFGKKPITSIDDVLFSPHLPHSTGNTHSCQPIEKTNYSTIKELGQHIIDRFWNTKFVYKFEDCNIGFKVGDLLINNFADWEKLNNPLDILKGNFKKGRSIRELMRHFSNVTELRSSNTTARLTESAVSSMLTKVSTSLSSDGLTSVIRNTAEEIVNIALKNVVENSDLQPQK